MEDQEDQGGTPKRRTLDLSLTQVAASALAAVVGSVLASQLGVYGTILGAAVVSVGATTGTAVFQHVFRRTGEQLREMATTPMPIEHARPADEPAVTEDTQVFDPFDPGGERTRMMARINPPDQGEAVAVYRGHTNLKPKGWKVYAITAAIVFALAMGTVGVIELASGKPAANLFTGNGGNGGGSGKPSSGTSAPVDPSPGASTARTGGSGGTVTAPNPGTSADPHPTTSTSTDPSPSSSPNPVNPTPTPHDSTSAPSATPGTAGDAVTPQSTPSP